MCSSVRKMGFAFCIYIYSQLAAIIAFAVFFGTP